MAKSIEQAEALSRTDDSQPSAAEVIMVKLSGGKSAVLLNSNCIYSNDHGMVLDKETSGEDLGASIAQSLGVELINVQMDEPLDEDWRWEDVYELLPVNQGLTVAEAEDLNRPKG